ncbi:MAG TPA: AI-2E family transporter [Allosphingosinicella sp.]|nr:AI-2E family transporter [Allosphingosinicella sp.]
MNVDPRMGRPPLFASWLGFVLAAAAAVVALWFLAQIVIAILLLFFAVVVGIALSAPVSWFMRRGLPRQTAALLTLLLFFGTIALLGALVIPRLAGQMVLLANQLPEFFNRIDGQIAALLERYPDLAQYFSGGSPTRAIVPSPAELFRGLGGVSLSLLGGIALAIIFFSSVAYVLLDPKPILNAYLGSLPRAYVPAGMRAYRRAARSVIGWTKASFVIGAIQAVAVFIFLSWMEVPAALVWAALAFFADFIPRIGGYVMAIPPVVLALTIGPMTAIWVGLYYLVSNEILGSVVAPKIRGATMQLHPVLLLFFTLAFALAFGLLGAIVATPAAAFFSAFYSEFYLKRPLRRSEH